MSSIIISIEGNIGSGKTTILSILKNKYGENKKIIFLDEPVNEWNTIRDKNNVTILQKFYENQERYSFAFQMMAYISRFTILKDALNIENSIIITERCLNTDRFVFAKMLYDSGKMEEVEYQIYLKWFEYFGHVQNTQKIIYIKVDPETAFERINKRSRDGESKISLEYLTICDKYHEEMINNIKNSGSDVLIINANTNIEESWLIQIDQFIRE
jgi:deoxyadenosine/deoxycytidine kinase